MRVTQQVQLLRRLNGLNILVSELQLPDFHASPLTYLAFILKPREFEPYDLATAATANTAVGTDILFVRSCILTTAITSNIIGFLVSK